MSRIEFEDDQVENVIGQNGKSVDMFRLFRLIEFVGCGQIENLSIRSQSPWFHPLPLVVRESESESKTQNPVVGEQIELSGCKLELCRELRRLEDGTVCTIEVRDSLPSRMYLGGDSHA